MVGLIIEYKKDKITAEALDLWGGRNKHGKIQIAEPIKDGVVEDIPEIPRNVVETPRLKFGSKVTELMVIIVVGHHKNRPADVHVKSKTE